MILNSHKSNDKSKIVNELFYIFVGLLINFPAIKTLKKTVRWIIGILLFTYAAIILLLNIPFIQQRLGVFVAHELSNTLNTHVSIGKINMGLLNRIIVDDLWLEDQNNDEMLKIARVSAKFEILPLFNGKIRINSIQLFGFNISLNKQTPESSPNFQFIIDALASKDDTPKESNIDLRINSILIRRGKLSYDVLSADSTPGRFNPQHVNLQNIIANISLKALQKDSINIAIKRLSIEEQSGFELKKLSFKAIANNQRATIDNFTLELPESLLAMDTIRVEYDSIDALKTFDEHVHFATKMMPSYITLRDLSAFVPTFSNFKDRINISFKAKGSINQLDCDYLSISSNENFQLLANASFQELSDLNNAFIYGQISRLSVSNKGVDFIFRNLSAEDKATPSVLSHLGDVSFNGEISGYFTDLVTYGNLHTDIGSIKTDLKVSTNTDNHLFAYSGNVESEGFNVGQLINNKEMGEAIFNINLKGQHYKGNKPEILLKGLISSFEFKDYKYENIELDGEYIKGGFNGKVSLDDPNALIAINGSINLSTRIPSFNLIASITDFNPHQLHLTPKYENAKFSVKVKADFQGNTIDNLIGKINIDSLIYDTPDKYYFMRNLNITADKNEEINTLNINSEFLIASLKGKYKYKTLPHSINNLLHKYLPSAIPAYNKATDNDFIFDIHINNTNLFSEILDIPIHIYSPATIKGSLNDNTQRIRLEGYFPRLRYKNNFIESGMFTIANNSEQLDAKVRMTNRKKDEAFNISLAAIVEDDIIKSTLDWGNNSSITYSGKLAASIHFFKSESSLEGLKTVIDIDNTDIILNDTIWNVHPSRITIAANRVNIDNFFFSHNERHIHINGQVSDIPTDTLKLNLKDINIGYVFDIAQVSDDVYFEGDATGTAYAISLLKYPILSTNLNIKNFTLNNGLLGDLNIYGAWNNESKGIFLDAAIKNEENKESSVKGYIYPLKPNGGLDLRIDADGLSIKFIEFYMNSIAEDLTGTASGKVRFYGKFKELTLDGSVMADASMKFDFLNTNFIVSDSIRLHPTGINFNQMKFSDNEGHTGTVNGYLRYNHFKNIQYHLDVQVNNMLLMNTNETSDIPFYGTVYGTGNALLSGNAQTGLNANVAMTTNRNTVFNYNIGSAAVATSTQFITFNDKTPRRSQDSIQITTYFEDIQNDEIRHESHADIRLNLLIDATPDATMRIIMDPATGDYISCKGSGNIRTEFYNKGDVKMFGTYRIQQGIYKFSIQEVIRKDFIIQDGSSITFNGPPLDASLDIQASYTVTSASLNDLIPDASAIVQQPNVKVNCIMNLSGILLHPTVKLDIALPNERDEIQTLVRNYISTEEQMTMQTLYLLGIGKFYMENNTGTQQSDMMSSVLSSTLSGQLNNLLSQIIDNNNWNIGTNLSTGEKGWTDVEVEGILSGQLLNNRLLINGNFGYRDNPMANTNFVGDFEAEYLLKPSGDIRLKAYNETNDRYYTKTNLTTQGVGIMFKKDFNRWDELFFWKKWRMKRIERKLKKEEEKLLKQELKVIESEDKQIDYLPSYIQLKRDSTLVK